MLSNTVLLMILTSVCFACGLTGLMTGNAGIAVLFLGLTVLLLVLGMAATRRDGDAP